MPTTVITHAHTPVWSAQVSNLQSILLSFTGGPAALAVADYAIELGMRHQANLTGLVFSQRFRLFQSDSPLRRSHHDMQAMQYQSSRSGEQLEQIKKRLTASSRAGLHYEISSRQGEPIAEMIREWHYHDLVIMGLRSAMRGQICYGPEQNVHELLTAGVRPILAVPRQHRPIHTALFATSGSMASAKALKRWLHMRLFPDVELHFVHIGKRSSAMLKHLDRTVEYAEAHGCTVVSRVVERGDASELLLPYAQAIDADLMIMGDGQRGLFRKGLKGSLTMQMIEQSTRPLFLAH